MPAYVEGSAVSGLCCLQLCAGAGRLSAKLRHSGFRTISVDHIVDRRSVHRSLRLDLSNPSCLGFLRSLLLTEKVCFVHVALPYGTCRTARAERVPKRSRLVKARPKCRTLRSQTHPEGRPDLEPGSSRRVEAANRIFKHVCKFLTLCCQLRIAVTLENPSRSFLWQVPCVRTLASRFALFPVKFQECMWGGKSDKWVTFLTNCVELSCLAKACDGNNQHESWQLVSQAKRGLASAYPMPLCSAIANAVLSAARAAGAVFEEPPEGSATASDEVSSGLPLRVEAHRQPRGNRLPPVVSEVVDCRWVFWGPTRPPRGSFRLDEVTCKRLSVNFPAKVLQWRETGEDCSAPPHNSESRHIGSEPPSKVFEVLVGTYRSGLQFLHEALRLQHPFDSADSLSDDIKRAIFQMLTQGPSEMQRWREATLGYYRERVAQLDAQEAELHGRLSEARQKVIQGKRILLFNEMARDAGLEDPELFHCQVVGSSLVGEEPPCPLFSEGRDSAVISVEQLMLTAKWTHSSDHLPRGGSPEMQRQVWDASLSEVEAGWLQGPLSHQQVADMVGPLYVVSPRFGLQQSDKLRLIDDLSCSHVNQAFCSNLKLDLGGIDEVAVVARTFLEMISDDGMVSCTLCDGTCLRGPLSSELSVQDARRLVGRTLDLEAAYKQCLVSESSLWASVLGIVSPSGSRELFVSHVLPFGARGSVGAFNRVSRALHLIGLRLFGLVWCNYVDDFPQVSLQAFGSADLHTAESFLDLVGWRFSTKAKKRLPFSVQFDALGVTFDLSSAAEGRVLVRNKESRVQQLCEEIDRLLQGSMLNQPHAASIMGRLHFAESQLFAKASVHRMRLCHARAAGKVSTFHVNGVVRQELEWAKEFLRTCPPRQLRIRTAENPVVIFTDASLECNSSVGQVGGVLVFRNNGSQDHPVHAYFSDQVPPEVLKEMQRHTDHVIAALEMLAVLIAVHLWGPMLLSKRCFFFVDNDSARGALIASYSPSLQLNKLMTVWTQMVMQHSIFPWLCRVPSASNIADAPSRGECTEVVQLGGAQHHISWCVVKKWLQHV